MTALAATRSLPWRERAFIIAALVGVTALAWIYLLAIAADGQAMIAAHLAPWTTVDAAAIFTMWAIMMVGMMVPSALPTVLLYAAVERRQRAKGHTVAPVGAFIAGYVAAWTGFSVAMTAIQWALANAVLLSPMRGGGSALFSGGILIAAGLYQWTPLKRACIRHCRTPMEFLARHWQPGLRNAVKMGVAHGGYCVGCCWMLMALLFVGGVMNLLWVAAICIFVLVEKLAPHGAPIGRFTGSLLFAWGIWVSIAGW